MDADLPRRRLHRMIALAWLLFWVLMVVTAVQDFLRNDSGPLWHPVLWETSSAFTATGTRAPARRPNPSPLKRTRHGDRRSNRTSGLSATTG